MSGAITLHLDAVQILVAAFFLFFAGLVFYLRREDKREGYPMEDVSPVGRPIEGFPPAPPPKTYLLLNGSTTQVPHDEPPATLAAAPLLRFPGAPLVPIGDPMRAEIGPGAYPLRMNEPFMAFGHPQVRPLRLARDWKVAPGDADPRALTVVDRRHVECGVVHDLWVDRAVRILRYLEVTISPGRTVLLPIYYADVKPRRGLRGGFVRVRLMLAQEFRRIPGLADPDQVTAREEDRINAYFAGALLFSGARQGGLMLAEPGETPR